MTRKTLGWFGVLGLSVLLVPALGGCEKEGTLEKAAEDVDEAAEEVAEDVEEAAEELEEAAEDATGNP